MVHVYDAKSFSLERSYFPQHENNEAHTFPEKGARFGHPIAMDQLT